MLPCERDIMTSPLSILQCICQICFSKDLSSYKIFTILNANSKLNDTVCIFFSPTKLWSGTCGTSLSIVAATNRLKNSKRALGISTRQFARSARKRTLQNKNKVVSKWEKHMLLKLNIYTCINVQCKCNGNKPNLNLSYLKRAWAHSHILGGVVSCICTFSNCIVKCFQNLCTFPHS